MSHAARASFVLVALLGLATLSTRAADNSISLRWKFAPRQISHYATSQDVKVQRMAGEKPEEFTSKQNTDMTWVVDSVDDDGNAHITQTVDRVRVESSGLGQKMAFDSNNDKLPEGADEASVEAMRAPIGQPVHLTIDQRGNVVDVRLSDKFSEKLKQSSQYGPLAAMFSRDNLKQMAGMNTLVLPADPVSKGMTWEQQATINDPMAGKQKLVTTYRYDGTEEHDGRKLDKISATAKISLADEKKPAQPFTVKDQKSNGVIWFDHDVGRIEEMQMTTKVVGEITLGANKIEETMTTQLHTKLVGEE